MSPDEAMERHFECMEAQQRERWRRQRVRNALLKRISDAGDMNIRIRGETWRIVLEAVSTRDMNFAYETADWLCYREIDAMALETLIRLGDWGATHQPAEWHSAWEPDAPKEKPKC